MDAADLFNQRCVFSELLYGPLLVTLDLIWIGGFVGAVTLYHRDDCQHSRRLPVNEMRNNIEVKIENRNLHLILKY